MVLRVRVIGPSSTRLVSSITHRCWRDLQMIRCIGATETQYAANASQSKCDNSNGVMDLSYVHLHNKGGFFDRHALQMTRCVEATRANASCFLI